MRSRRHRRTANPSAPGSDDPYAAYLDWVAAGRPDLAPVDLRAVTAVALPGSVPVRGSEPGSASAPVRLSEHLALSASR